MLKIPVTRKAYEILKELAIGGGESWVEEKDESGNLLIEVCEDVAEGLENKGANLEDPQSIEDVIGFLAQGGSLQ